MCSAFEKERQKSRKLARLKRVRSRLIGRTSSFSSTDATPMSETPLNGAAPPCSEGTDDDLERRAFFPTSAPSPIPPGRNVSIIPPLSESFISAESVALSLLGHFSKLQVPAASDMEWLVSEKDAPQHVKYCQFLRVCLYVPGFKFAVTTHAQELAC